MFDGFGPDLGDPSFWHEPDFLLADLISLMVNKAGMQLGVTLFLKGIVITGTLISEREYLKALSEAFVTQARKSAPNKLSKDELKALQDTFDFTTLTEDSYPEQGDLSGDDEDDEDDFDLDDDVGSTTIRHLHLKDPAILSPQPSITFTHGEFSMMRLRLTTVDGWMLGRSTVFNPDDDIPPILH